MDSPAKKVVTIETLRASGWKAALGAAAVPDCQSFAREFANRRAEAERDGDVSAAAANELLERVSFLVLQDSDDAPFGDNIRELVSDGDLDGLSAFRADLDDPELQARLADLVWLLRRQHAAARAAVPAYLASAMRLEDPREWSRGFARIRRALQLAARLERNGELFRQVITFIEETLARLNGKDPLFASARLLELLLGARVPGLNATNYGAHATAMGENAATAGDCWRAEALFNVSAGWYDRAKEPDKARAARIASAECFVAVAASSEPGVAAHHIQRAIGIYRRVGKASQRIDELMGLMGTYQRGATETFADIGSDVDISDEVAQALAAVRGKATLVDALIALATFARSPSVPEMRASVQARVVASPLALLIPQVIVDMKTGRTTGRRNVDLTSPNIDAVLFQEARQQQHLIAAIIDPARRLICNEHVFGDRDLLPLVRTSPFVPPGREMKCARGLAAGLRGDFMLATALLVPQLENSLRQVLEDAGGRAFGLDESGIQDAHLLGHLLDSKEIRNLLGEDIVFDLRGLLNERCGTNLRNLEAHGLLNDADYDSSEGRYCWWLTLRLCTLFSLAASKRADEHSN